ncbi:unnamed protein product, partial [Bubo scandiacus]
LSCRLCLQRAQVTDCEHIAFEEAADLECIILHLEAPSLTSSASTSKGFFTMCGQADCEKQEEAKGSGRGKGKEG